MNCIVWVRGRPWLGAFQVPVWPSSGIYVVFFTHVTFRSKFIARKILQGKKTCNLQGPIRSVSVQSWSVSPITSVLTHFHWEASLSGVEVFLRAPGASQPPDKSSNPSASNADGQPSNAPHASDERNRKSYCTSPSGSPSNGKSIAKALWSFAWLR
jgi:hypothetical protein